MMKNFSMNKVLGTIKKRNTSDSTTDIPAVVDPATEQPQDTAARCVKAFCESTGSSTGDDVIYLPAIVEAAVASPVAATESARLIRKFLSRDYWSRPACQYNAIMLIRILSDNPGPGFTRNFDKKFVDVCKDLLRAGRDSSVRQLLMETLDTFETSKGYDEGLNLIIAMWQKEKKKAYEAYSTTPSTYAIPRNHNVPPYPQQYPQQPPSQYPQPPHHHGHHHSSSRSSRHRLPDPIELANRLEEARTSAKLLEQLVASTPTQEVLANDLIKEFSERCTGASKSIQGYMSCENPAPDNDTMESLIDTNEQLQQALNQHHRAVLQAKKHLGEARSDNNTPVSPSSQQDQPPVPPRKPMGSGYGGNGFGVAGGAGFGPSGSSSRSNSNGKGKASAEPSYRTNNPNPAYGPSASMAGPSRSNTGTPAQQEDDPFRDPEPRLSTNNRRVSEDETPRLGYEPFHPGFGGGGAGNGSAGEQVGAGPSSKKNKDVEPVTPISDTTEEQDDAYTRAARERPTAGGSGSEQVVKDPGPLYRY
ncbi:hypothetical protein QC763_120860 [Podospora pseudopauciseta]|uniref:GAT domain-containing protein n=2 Tax=Podospora TaxID=5144 RepID=A0ABR0I2V1_9PEZI|nr:hypothetical protein QC763_120860 [Podospora pseudopauciseta]KAK4682963.1 hypothetical protein QC764_120860 [Podospora pseudoanserina]